MPTPIRLVNDLQPLALLIFIGAMLVLPGCGDDEIEIYQAPKMAVDANASDHAHENADGHEHADHAPKVKASEPQTQSPKAPKVSFTLPQGWQETQAGNMVLNRLTTPSKATVAISAFPGDVGGMIANVNRWRNQLGLAPETPEQIKAALKPQKLGTQEAVRVDLANDTQRLIVVFGMVEGKTWFFKLTGSTDQINKELTAFDTFLSSVDWAQCCPGVEK